MTEITLQEAQEIFDRVRAAIKKEREACAKVADDLLDILDAKSKVIVKEIAAGIRARGGK